MGDDDEAVSAKWVKYITDLDEVYWGEKKDGDSGEHRGTLAQFRRAVSRGDVHAATLVWFEGRERWAQFKEAKHLRKAAGVGMPPPALPAGQFFEKKPAARRSTTPVRRPHHPVPAPNLDSLPDAFVPDDPDGGERATLTGGTTSDAEADDDGALEARHWTRPAGKSGAGGSRSLLGDAEFSRRQREGDRPLETSPIVSSGIQATAPGNPRGREHSMEQSGAQVWPARYGTRPDQVGARVSVNGAGAHDIHANVIAEQRRKRRKFIVIGAVVLGVVLLVLLIVGLVWWVENREEEASEQAARQAALTLAASMTAAPTSMFGRTPTPTVTAAPVDATTPPTASPTHAPTTRAPTAAGQTSHAPVSAYPTHAPTSHAPTANPTTEAPTTTSPTTAAPTQAATQAPTASTAIVYLSADVVGTPPVQTKTISGVKRFYVARCHFSDRPQADTWWTTAHATTLAANLAANIKEQTYGRVSFVTTVSPQLIMLDGFESYDKGGAVATGQALRATVLSKLGAAASNYDAIVLGIPKVATTSLKYSAAFGSWVGLGLNFPGSLESWLFLQLQYPTKPDASKGVAVHEFTHALGYPRHARSWFGGAAPSNTMPSTFVEGVTPQCNTNPANTAPLANCYIEYGDFMDPLGPPAFLGDSQSNAAIKWYLGMTTSTQRIFVDDASEFGKTVKLYALDGGISTASKVVTVAVPSASSSDQFYWAEYRPTWQGSMLSSSSAGAEERFYRQTGAVLHWAGSAIGPLPSLLFDTTPTTTTAAKVGDPFIDSMLAAGRTWSDAATKVHLTVTREYHTASPPYLEVVAYRSPATNQPPVASGVKLLTAGVVCACSSAKLQCDASDADGHTMAFEWNLGRSPWLEYPAQQGLAVIDHVFKTAGVYPVTCKATDMRGGVSAATPALSVTIVGGATATITGTGVAGGGAQHNEAAGRPLIQSFNPSYTTTYLNGARDAVSCAKGCGFFASKFDVAGVRFAGVQVPKGTVVTDAKIQFKSYQPSTRAAKVTIYAHNAGDSAAVAATDLFANRAKTTASVVWNVPSWGNREEGPAEQTPNLAAVLTEVFARADWASNNALSIIVTHDASDSADGMRVTYGVPVLTISYLDAAAKAAGCTQTC